MSENNESVLYILKLQDGKWGSDQRFLRDKTYKQMIVTWKGTLQPILELLGIDSGAYWMVLCF